MTDERFVLQETNKERSKMKTGAYHKKSGAKSKKCTLPYEYLSRKERKALNGIPTSWNMNWFYTWQQFKQMPKDLQVEYLENICSKYGCGLGTIGEIVFGISGATMWNYTSKNDIHPNIKKTAGTGAKLARERLRAAVSEQRDPKPVIHEELSEEPQDIPNTVETEEPAKTTKVSSANITTDGFDLETFQWLQLMFANKKVTVVITVREEF